MAGNEIERCERWKSFQCAVLKVYDTSYSSLAQSVEHSAVNRVVVGSSPTGGVNLEKTTEKWLTK